MDGVLITWIGVGGIILGSVIIAVSYQINSHRYSDVKVTRQAFFGVIASLVIAIIGVALSYMDCVQFNNPF